MPKQSARSNKRKGRLLYQQVADMLRERISTGHYQVGELLPTVSELAGQFNVGRHTMREALSQLKNAGIISIRRREGTRVEGTLPDMGGELIKAFETTSEYSLSLALRVITKEHIIARREVAELLQCPPGQQWFKITAVRESGTPPVPRGYTEVYINSEYPKIFEKISKSTRRIYPLLKDIYGEEMIEVRQEVRAITITGANAVTLDVANGSTGLRYISRFITSKGIQAEVAINIHPHEALDAAKRVLFPRPM